MRDLPRPKRSSLLFVDDYKSDDLGMVMTSRGCPARCAFCCSRRLWGQNVIHRDIGDVIAEMRDIRDVYGTRHFYLVDDTFTCNKTRVAAFCDAVKVLGITWSCLTRADCLTPGMLHSMKSSGCTQVKVGVESGSPAILKRLKKGVGPKQVRLAAEMLRDAGIPWVAYAMCGLPGETTEDMNATRELLNECGPDFISLAVFTPYPGTDLYDELGCHNIPHHLLNHHSNRTLNGPVGSHVKEMFAWADAHNGQIVGVA